MANWQRFFEPGGRRHRHRHGRSCHNASLLAGGSGLKKVVLVGSPNVGKSVIFNRLTGAYVTVSNYPGTTVEVSRGKARISTEEFEVVDTPGMYSLLPITEEERVTRKLLLEEKPDVVVHVIDVKNIQRMLPLTIQLAEAGLPLILDLNIMDEAERIGMNIDVPRLENLLGIPVVPTVATTGRGMEDLQRRIASYGATTIAS